MSDLGEPLEVGILILGSPRNDTRKNSLSNGPYEKYRLPMEVPFSMEICLEVR